MTRAELMSFLTSFASRVLKFNFRDWRLFETTGKKNEKEGKMQMITYATRRGSMYPPPKLPPRQLPKTNSQNKGEQKMDNTNADFTCHCRSCRNSDQQQYNFQARLVVDCDDDLAIEITIATNGHNVPIIETVKLSTMDEKYFKNSKFSLACFCAPREQPLSEYMKKQNKKNEEETEK